MVLTEQLSSPLLPNTVCAFYSWLPPPNKEFPTSWPLLHQIFLTLMIFNICESYAVVALPCLKTVHSVSSMMSQNCLGKPCSSSRLCEIVKRFWHQCPFDTFQPKWNIKKENEGLKCMNTFFLIFCAVFFIYTSLFLLLLMDYFCPNKSTVAKLWVWWALFQSTCSWHYVLRTVNIFKGNQRKI